MLKELIQKIGRLHLVPVLMAGAAVAAAPTFTVAQTKSGPAAKTTDEAGNKPKSVGTVAGQKAPAAKSAPPVTVKSAKPGTTIPEPTVVLKEGEVPDIKFDTPVYDFGRVKFGSDVEHEFMFTNSGTGPLEILQVKPSCGCTVAGAYDKVVAPGKTGKIPLKVRLGAASGQIAKSITVHTNAAGANASIILQIKGDVWKPVQVTPPSAAFGRITADDADKSMTRKLTLVNNLEGKLELGKPTSSSPAFKAEISPIEEGKKYEVTVTLVPPLSSGNNTGTISFTTGTADMPKVDIPVYAFVTAPIDVTPNALALPVNRTADVSRQFYVRSNTDRPIKISELKATNPEIKLDLSDMKDSKTFRLKVDVPASYKFKAGDQITFKTDNSAVPSITIPLNETQGYTGAPPKRNMNRQMIAGPNGTIPAPPATAKKLEVTPTKSPMAPKADAPAQTRASAAEKTASDKK